MWAYDVRPADDTRGRCVGVDTHKHATWRGDRHEGGPPRRSIVCRRSDGYQQLITWAERSRGLVPVRRAGHQVLEVNRGDRRTRRIAGKSDPVRSVLGDRHPEDRGRSGRDDAPPQSRSKAHDHAEVSSPRRPRCERPSTLATRSSNAAADGAAARSIRRPPRRNIPSVGARPSLVRSLRRNRGGSRDLTDGASGSTADHLWRIHREAPHPDDGAPPPLPRRSSPGQRRAPPGRHRADAVPHTNPQLRRTTHR